MQRTAFFVALLNGHAVGVKVFDCTNRLKVLVQLANVVPQSDSACRVVRHGTQVAGIEEHGRVIGDLIATRMSWLDLNTSPFVSEQ